MMDRILCATDGSKSSEKAIDFAIELAKQEGTALTFVTVNTVSDEDTSVTYFWDSALLEAGDKQIDIALKIAESKAKAAGLSNFRSVTVHGRNIAAVLIGFAEESGHNHIVTGSVGRTGVPRLLMGSVAYEVVAKAHCPVTIVR